MATYRFCLLIPNFNHSHGFRAFVEKLVNYNLPILIINDGSNEKTRTLLTDINNEHQQVTVIHLPYNQGKGGAVKAGFYHAWQQGYSHALQIDADGQHNHNDIPDFLVQSEEKPEAVITGCPVYDASIPNSRLYFRNFNHVWVWLETLSFTIKDSMCGFRVYPLKRTIAMLKQESLGQRMDFDIEILVRLYWYGADIINLPTRVIYPEDGLSNFRLWRDNWLITKMHCCLLIGMIRHVPALLRRPKIKPHRKHWATLNERGSFFGFQALLWIYTCFGRVPFKLVLHPVALYFSLFAGSARKASLNYLGQLNEFQDSSSKPGWRQCYFHFYSFGIAALDKIACWKGDIKRNDVTVHHPEMFNEILASGKGAVFIGSHLGNIEVCRALGEKAGRFKINALVFNKHAAKFQRVLSKNVPDAELNLIHVEQIGVETGIMLKQKVEAGEIVIIVGDRTPVGSVGRVQYVDFLGKPAPFSQGPFVLAAALDCPVYLLMCVNEEGKYNIYLEKFASTLKFKRAERERKMQEKIQTYADRLGSYCVKAPLQWFNFYDFWDTDNAMGAIEILASEKK